MMNRETPHLLAACGLYCGACYHYQASFLNETQLRDEAARRGRDPQGYTCKGCRSEVLYIHSGCAQCDIRACADEKGISHCGLCPELPCERILAFQNDGRVHHRNILIQLAELCAKGEKAWLAEQAQRWSCTCGEGFSWYDEVCHNCGRPLASYGADPTIK